MTNTTTQPTQAELLAQILADESMTVEALQQALEGTGLYNASTDREFLARGLVISKTLNWDFVNKCAKK